ncbi:MAG: hypothetical protein IJ306_01165 [Oscillospiraceae bacterium]|nr:hypothetical protein [Oscillospiraceae bacterium]
MAKNAEQGTNVEENKQGAVVDDGMVTIKLPLTRTEKDDVYVALNGKTFLIKRGEEVRVPRGVAEILQHSEEMLREAIEFEAAHMSKD